MENQTVNKNINWNFKGHAEYIDKWSLMESPIPVFLIWLFYIMFVLKLGPSTMKNRSPFSLNKLLVVYNAVQVVVSIAVTWLGIRLTLSHGLIQTNCLADDKNIASGIHWYFLAKISELLDTVFFVLRKKQSQVTFLHVYHHSLMVWTTWLTLKYEPSYTPVFLGTLNSFVHVVMYTYYGLSAFPSMSKYLWWKKYITKMQLIQFCCIVAQALVNYKYTPCRVSYTLLYSIIFNALLFVYLFGDFYIKSYLKNNKAEANGTPVKKVHFDSSKYLTCSQCPNGTTFKESVAKPSNGIGKVGNGTSNGIKNGNVYANGKASGNGICNGHMNGNGIVDRKVNDSGLSNGISIKKNE